MSNQHFYFNHVVNLIKLFFLLVLLSCSLSLYAQQFDQAYLNWKAQQQAHDAQLKKVDDQYYLSRPNSQKPPSNSNHKGSSSSAQSSNSSALKVSLNSANAEQLQQLTGVGAKKAQAIIAYRNQNGGFKSIDDLKKVKGIGEKLFEQNRARLSL
ncbi:ComEA family DNA-binding protein [Acinetobacter guillouiae]|uniref:ComEA family DNA-binding protein n=1 Tax=Acinetobacter guillouiae TaxID=106649 RepID=UPI0021D041DD|nr:ComEA family DNA-binding protein [Acinetobacter guillouiae]MCU4494241.1 ComEA family DNA-binding protein [Acinetobacter guillouiae]